MSIQLHKSRGVRGEEQLARLKALREASRLDQFAELISIHDAATGDRGGRVAEAAEVMGYADPQGMGNALLQRLRRKIGPQAS